MAAKPQAAGDVDEEGGVGFGAVGVANDRGVAAFFAVAADLAADEPDGGVEEEERLDNSLQQVDEVVPAADVGELVEQHHVELLGGPAGERGGREEDQRADDADEDRLGDAVGRREGDAAGDL